MGRRRSKGIPYTLHPPSSSRHHCRRQHAPLAAAVAVLVTEARELRWCEAEHARVQRCAVKLEIETSPAAKPTLRAQAAHIGQGRQRCQPAAHRRLQRGDGSRRQRTGAREQVRGGECVVPGEVELGLQAWGQGCRRGTAGWGGRGRVGAGSLAWKCGGVACGARGVCPIHLRSVAAVRPHSRVEGSVAISAGACGARFAPWWRAPIQAYAHACLNMRMCRSCAGPNYICVHVHAYSHAFGPCKRTSLEQNHRGGAERGGCGSGGAVGTRGSIGGGELLRGAEGGG